MQEVMTAVAPVTNGAKSIIEDTFPYVATITVEGTADLLFHAWNVEAVEGKAKAAKGSKTKKTDDPESYVYRDGNGFVCIPTEYFRQSIIHAAKYIQDPRSPRKSAMDLFKAGISNLSGLCSLGKKDWDYLDRRRVVVQRSGISRTRPAFLAGWQATFELQILTPEYISPALLNSTTQQSGRLVGVGDFRPTYGRFQIVNFKVDTKAG